jgi:hypothetical protein
LKFGSSSASKSAPPSITAVGVPCGTAGAASLLTMDPLPHRRPFRRRSPAHLGALLFQNRLARQLDAVAFDGQNFHQHLVAFFQFIANIFDSVFGDFADVQQSVQSRQNLDERAEIRQAADLAEISLPHFGRGRESRIICKALLAETSSFDATLTLPESSTSIFTPVCSMMLRIILPPGPITSRILSTGICRV